MPMTPVAMAALDAEIAGDLLATDITNDAAADETDGTGDEPACHGADGGVRCAPRCIRSRSRGGECGRDEGKSAERFH